MNKIASPKIIALIFGILVLTFLAVFYVVAWQEPSEAPPGGNVSAPLNTGATGQSKAGGLILNTSGAPNALVIDKGNLCFGADCRDEWPATGVVTTYRLEAQGYISNGYYYADTASYTCPEESNVVSPNLSVVNYTVGPSNGGGCVWGCYSGDIWPGVPTNSCSYSISGSTVTLRARVAQREEVDCACWVGQSLVDSCYNHRTSPWGYPIYTCYILSPCSLEFQCGIKQTVGQ